jgi:hypothetical protein
MKCTNPLSEDIQKVPESYTIEMVDEPYKVLSSFNFRKPEETETATSGVISRGNGWPVHIQPFPALHAILASNYPAKRLQLHNERYLRQELHYWLQLCLNSDPILHPTDWHLPPLTC